MKFDIIDASPQDCPLDEEPAWELLRIAERCVLFIFNIDSEPYGKPLLVLDSDSSFYTTVPLKAENYDALTMSCEFRSESLGEYLSCRNPISYQ